ncbi:MAG: hypothetical protein GXO78_06960 [Calditrichaeota bacterium]|nr:hypothetical protein [Calditrichota bacterium]
MSGKLKSILYLPVLIFLMNSCNDKSENRNIKVLENSSDFESIHSYRIDEYSLLTGATHILLDGENFYFTNIISRAIYFTQRPFSKFVKVGKNGQGPFEYRTPYYIFVKNDTLFYSDIHHLKIKWIPLETAKKPKAPRFEYIEYACRNSGAKFVVGDKYVFVLNKTGYLLSILDKRTGRLIKEMIETDALYDLPNIHLNGGGIVKAGNFIYASRVAPFMIYKVRVDTREGEFELQNQFNFEHASGMIPWSDDLRHIAQNDPKDFFNTLNQISAVSEIFLIGKDKSYLLVKLSRPGMFVYYVIDLNGTVQDIYRSKMNLICASQDQLFFFQRIEDNPQSPFELREFRIRSF